MPAAGASGLKKNGNFADRYRADALRRRVFNHGGRVSVVMFHGGTRPAHHRAPSITTKAD